MGDQDVADLQVDIDYLLYIENSYIYEFDKLLI